MRRILAEFADEIERVDIFGSRASGAWRPNSDVDLVLHGAVSEATVDRLWTLFQECSLPFSVDVKSYEQTRYAPLRAHMDAVCRTLFTHEELMGEKAAIEAGPRAPGQGG
jgi:predicted nucleotidyltransferase